MLSLRGLTRVARPHRSLAVRSFSDNATHMREWLRPNKKFDLEAHSYETLALDYEQDHVLHLKLNRPKQLNAFNMQMWVDLGDVFEKIEWDPSIRAVIVSGEGRGFTSGMDLSVFTVLQQVLAEEKCQGRMREGLMRGIDGFQRVITAAENCRVPVIAAVHGPCIGAGVDFITACDLRYCDTSAVFSVKEVDLAIVADCGTLQRLPKLIGEQRAKELSYTGRNFSGVEAERLGFVLKTLNDQEELLKHVKEVAASITDKSPLTIRGIKHAINYQRDHSTQDSLRQIQYHNATVVPSDDLATAITAIMTKSKATFRED